MPVCSESSVGGGDLRGLIEWLSFIVLIGAEFSSLLASCHCAIVRVCGCACYGMVRFLACSASLSALIVCFSTIYILP